MLQSYLWKQGNVSVAERPNHYQNFMFIGTERETKDIILHIVKNVKRNTFWNGEKPTKGRTGQIQSTIGSGITTNALKSERKSLNYSEENVQDVAIMPIGELSKLTMLMVEAVKNIASFVAIRNCLKIFKGKGQENISYSVLTATKSRDMKITRIGNSKS